MTQEDLVWQRLDALERRIENLEAEQHLKKWRDIIQLLVIILTLIGSLYGAAHYLGKVNRQLLESFRHEIRD